MRDPILAGVLSLIIPGVGQLYNGRILAGILWLIFTPGFWIGTGGTLGWVCHIVAAYCAYSYAKEHPVRCRRSRSRSRSRTLLRFPLSQAKKAASYSLPFLF